MTARSRSKNIARSLVGGFAAVATVVTCAAQAGQAQRPSAGAARTPATPPAAVTAAPGVPVPAEYVIGADDVLSIVFWRDKELSSDVTVRPDGNVSIPLINDVHAAGLTPAQLKDRIVDESKKYVEDPNVTVVVKTINSRKVFITGEVKKPGAYALTEPTTVLQLISVSGGLGDYAKSEKILVVRMNSGKPVSYRFNYKEVINQQKLAQNIELKPGDTVVVP
jgi:polysaccharide biosynthesis/export protein